MEGTATEGKKGREIRTLLVSVTKTGVQRVRNLIEDVCRHLLAVLIEQVDLNRPRSERKPFNARIFVPVDASIHQHKQNLSRGSTIM